MSGVSSHGLLGAGKKRRLTLLECGSDLNTMLDVAKVADLVLLLVDASFGFEMETFEFLNILQVPCRTECFVMELSQIKNLVELNFVQTLSLEIVLWDSGFTEIFVPLECYAFSTTFALIYSDLFPLFPPAGCRR